MSKQRITVARLLLSAAVLGAFAAIAFAGFVLAGQTPPPSARPAAVWSDAPLRAAAGPLRVSSRNPRYFADPSGRVIYLTGAHTWDNFQDIGTGNPPKPFDFDAYLRLMRDRRHNFVRLWRYESAKVSDPEFKRVLYCEPHPWRRAGAKPALDGKPQFDLEQFDPAYFERLRQRVEAAGRQGIYVSVMLFEGWALRFTEDAWLSHPFHQANNANGIHADADGDGKGLEYATLRVPSVTRLQEAYIRKVVDTINDLDNVLYEISNENHWDSHAWEIHLVRFLREYQAGKPQQHPIGMTSNGGGGPDDTQRLFAGPADWVSPNAVGFDYKNNPPPADGRKVILTDTDHLWGLGGSRAWVWKSFLRGLNPIFMDPHEGSFWLDRGESERWESIRTAMGHTAWFAHRLDLARMAPASALSSSTFCLAEPGTRYLIYLPSSTDANDRGRTDSSVARVLRKLQPADTPRATVDLSAARGSLEVEWFEPGTGKTYPQPAVQGGSRVEFTAPFSGDAVLLLHGGA